MKNSKCIVRPEIFYINNNNPIYYPFSFKVNKCSGSCNNINNPYAKICVPDATKDLNVRVFNLMSRTNEKRHMKWHETCKCISRLDKIIFNSKQRWNEDKCRCNCKELIDKGACNKGFIWNPGNCECECDESCNVGECLDYSDCKCKKKLANRLIDECIETIEETKIFNITVENKNYYECTSCIVYIVFMIVAFTIFIAITVYLIYYNWYLINNNNNYNLNHNNNGDDDDDDNDDKNKNLMNVIIKN